MVFSVWIIISVFLTLLTVFIFLKSRVDIKKLTVLHQEKLKELDKTAKTLVRRDFELSQILETLREIDQAKTHFVTVAAHQLRTPLSAVKWTLRLFLEGDMGQLTAEQKEYLKASYETNERMIKLVNDLLNVSRIESGRFPYTFREDDILLVVKEVIATFSNSAKEKNIEISLEESKDKFMMVMDRDKIQMVIQNLVENSISYTPVSGKIVISLLNKNSDIYISIKDTGIGVSSEEKQHLFTKFYRAEGAVRLFPNGSGLGLFLSQNIALRHGGRIEVESEIGKGSIFTLVLPKKGIVAQAPAETEMKNFVQGNNHI